MSQQKVAEIFDKWWFGASLYGGATLTLLLAKSPFLAGMALGMGIMYFYRLFIKGRESRRSK